MRSRSRPIVIPLFILVFGVVGPLRAGAQSQSRVVEATSDSTDLVYDLICYAFLGPSVCVPLSETSSHDEVTDAAPDSLPWSGSVLAQSIPGESSPGIASQDSSITASKIEGSGFQTSTATCVIADDLDLGIVEVFDEFTTARSRLDVEFEVSQPTTFSLSGEVNLSGDYILTSYSTAFVRLSVSGGPVLSETLVSEIAPCGELPGSCPATEEVAASGLLAPGLYRIEAEATGSTGCGFSFESETSDFDFELVLTTPVPLLDGGGVAVLVAMMLGAGVYGSRGRREQVR